MNSHIRTVVFIITFTMMVYLTASPLDRAQVLLKLSQAIGMINRVVGKAGMKLETKAYATVKDGA